MINLDEYTEVTRPLTTPRGVYEETILPARVAVFTNADGQVFVVFDPEQAVFVEYTTGQIVRVERVDVAKGLWKVYQKKDWFDLASPERPVLCKVMRNAVAPKFFYDAIIGKVGNQYTAVSGDTYGALAVTVTPLTDLELESFKRGL